MAALRSLAWGFGKLWCQTFHRDVTRPVHGVYACFTCQRIYESPYK